MMNSHPARGFTLLELLIILTIVSILGAVAVPGVGELHRQNKLSSVINSYSAAHRLARSEAVVQGKAVTICKRSTADANVIACDPDNEWESGWVVFLNTDLDNPAQVDAGEAVFQVAQSITSSFSLRSSGATEDHITYGATGEVQAFGSFILCDKGMRDKSRMLDININGRIQIAELSSNNVPLDSSGSEITSCTP